MPGLKMEKIAHTEDFPYLLLVASVCLSTSGIGILVSSAMIIPKVYMSYNSTQSQSAPIKDKSENKVHTYNNITELHRKSLLCNHGNRKL